MSRLLVLCVVAAVIANACGDTSGSEESDAPSISPTSLAAPPILSSPTDDDRTAEAAPVHDAAAPADGVVLRYGKLTERTIDIGADGRNTVAAVDSMNAFAVDLYSAVSSDMSGNVVLSPYSVAFALSMIYAGASGDTATEMAEVLHADVPPPAWHEGINAYDLTLDARTAGSPTTWAAANKVWTAPGLILREDYLDTLTGAYGAPLAEADFAGDVDVQRAAINGWVDERTNELIPELFPPGSISPATVMVLVNAVALDAPWEFPFDPTTTRDGQFTRADGSTVSVPMMAYDEFLPAWATDEMQAVELPYGGGALSMVVIVPPDLAAFEANLTVESLESVIDSIKDGGIHLTMPRWTARTHLRLDDTLKALGMPTAFSGAADFSGMVDGGDLSIDRVEHEAFIEVDEDGTRAAAATGGAMLGSHGPTIAVDRPFLYVIRDQGAGTILFIGRVTDPTIAP